MQLYCSGNRYGIQQQNYVALLQGSKNSAGFPSRNLILGIQCFSLTTLNVMSLVKWLANQISNTGVEDRFLGEENLNLYLTPDVNQGNKKARWIQDFVWPQGGMDSLFGSSTSC